MSLDPIYVEFEGDEQIYLRYADLDRAGERLSSRRERNPVFVGLADEQGFPHEGYMIFVDNQINPRTGTIRARALLENDDGGFTPGLFARVALLGSGRYRAVLISDRAVGTDQDRKFVLVVGQGDVLEYRNVRLGRTVDGLRIVLEGLKPGERIVVNGLQRVRPGMKVATKTVPMDLGIAPGRGFAPPRPAQAQAQAQ